MPTPFYINSYPRSGNTWMRNALRPLVLPWDVDINPQFFETENGHQWHAQRKVDWVQAAGKDPSCATHNKYTMVKSHCRYEHVQPGVKVIYLVRDGRDSLISYFHFNVTKRGYQEDFNSYFHRHVVLDEMKGHREEVLRHYMGTWGENALSYLGKPDVMIIRFEDLVAQPLEGVNAMLQFIGAKAAEEDVVRVLAKLDAALARDGKKDPSRPRGTTRNWEKMMSPEQNAQFEERHREALEAFGYGPNSDPNAPLSGVWSAGA